jgi:hypothetical protein
MDGERTYWALRLVMEFSPRVRLLVGQEYSAPVYTVRLAASAVLHATGHIYKYFEEGRRGKFPFEARPLFASTPSTR